MPATAFLRDPSALSPPGVAAAASATLTPNAPKPRVTSGTAGYLGVFTDAADLGNSVMYQQSGLMGVNTTTPLDVFHVAFNNGNGAATGYAVQNLNPAGDSGMLFYGQNGALGRFKASATRPTSTGSTTSPRGAINFLIGSSSKFYVANRGNVGISNPTPNYALDVAGDINLTGGLRLQGTPILQVGLAFSDVASGPGPCWA